MQTYLITWHPPVELWGLSKLILVTQRTVPVSERADDVLDDPEA